MASGATAACRATWPTTVRPVSKAAWHTSARSRTWAASWAGTASWPTARVPGLVAGGLHIEPAPDSVVPCVVDDGRAHRDVQDRHAERVDDHDIVGVLAAGVSPTEDVAQGRVHPAGRRLDRRRRSHLS